MAQDHADSAEAIYEALSGNEGFMDLVGTYTLRSNNTALPSLTIQSPGQSLPPLRSQSGLEVIIHDVANHQRRNYISGEYDKLTTWRVFLIAWPPATGTTINDAVSIIMDTFISATVVDTVPASTALGALTQSLVLIPSDSIILTP